MRAKSRHSPSFLITWDCSGCNKGILTFDRCSIVLLLLATLLLPIHKFFESDAPLLIGAFDALKEGIAASLSWSIMAFKLASFYFTTFNSSLVGTRIYSLRCHGTIALPSTSVDTLSPIFGRHLTNSCEGCWVSRGISLLLELQSLIEERVIIYRFIKRVVDNRHRSFNISHQHLPMWFVDLRLTYLVVLANSQVTMRCHCIHIALDLERMAFALLRC